MKGPRCAPPLPPPWGYMYCLDHISAPSHVPQPGFIPVHKPKRLHGNLKSPAQNPLNGKWSSHNLPLERGRDTWAVTAAT